MCTAAANAPRASPGRLGFLVARSTLVLAGTALIVGACTAPRVGPAAEVASAGSPAASAEAAVVDEAFLAEQAAKAYFPSDHGAVMIAVIDADGTVLSASRTADPSDEPPSVDAAYRVGSITKLFTALLTLLLVDEGLVDLDAPASAYVTRVPVPDDVTVRDLLRHTSGIPDPDELEIRTRVRRGDPHQRWMPESTIALADDEPLSEPGTEFAYSNTNYLILGVLIEEVTGQPFHAELRGRLLEPLSLEDTYLEGYENGPAPFPAFTDLRGPMGPIDFDYTALATTNWAGGAMISSAGDLHALLDAVFDGRVVSEPSLQAMTAGPGYGLGIEPLGESGDIYGHGGHVPGYLALVAHDPRARTTTFWAATNDRVDIQPMVRDILDRID